MRYTNEGIESAKFIEVPLGGKKQKKLAYEDLRS